MWVPWNLQRNPLVPSVPLEGSDTVQGLRTLERLRAAELLSVEGTYRNSRHDRDKIRSSRPRRSRYQRYKGPFIEFLGAEDLTREGKPWKEFGGQMTSKRNGTRFFDVPASLDLLSERIDENLVYYAGNYLRMSLVILLLMTYLRPKSIVGILVVGYNIFSNYGTLVSSQTGGMETQQQNMDSNRTIFMAGLTWLAMIYSKCMSIIALALLLSTSTVLLHASLRRAPSEDRYKGRKPLSFSFQSVLRGLPRDSRKVFREGMSEMVQYVTDIGISVKRWSRYYALCLLDNVKNLFRR